MRTEIWNEHEIRFVEIDNEWYAVGKDVAQALGYKKPENAVGVHVSNCDKTTTLIQGTGSNYKSKSILISEFGIYDLVFSSKLESAKKFKRWVFDVIKTLREQTGLQGFEVFRMLDKEHQKAAMNKLRDGLNHPVRVNFIKANTVANKAISNKYDYPKMIKKSEMSPQMLAEREPILDDVVQLMELKDKYGIDLSVSKTIYAGVK